VEERKDACKKGFKYFWRAFEVICAFPAADMEEGSEGGKKRPGGGTWVAQGMRIKSDMF
jgi:hypothetical protein